MATPQKAGLFTAPPNTPADRCDAVVARTALRRLAQERFADRVRLVAVGHDVQRQVGMREDAVGNPNNSQTALQHVVEAQLHGLL